MQINTSISIFHSINQQFYRVEMGQNQSNCYNPQAKQQDFLKTQMLTYEWRSDRRYNTFIPRVTIEFGPQALKQQQFLKFIDDSKESNYLNLEQFHSKYGLDHAKQVLVFEKYSSTLQEINDSLSLPEVVYVLTAFILGLRAIAKKFKEIIVSRRCCFITKTGQVRVWINSNEKHNYVQWELQQQIFQASNHKSILLKTLFEVLKSARKTDNNMKLFTTLRCFLQKSNNDRDLFEATRQKISQYSGQINIELINKLNQRLSNNPIFTDNTSSIPNQYYPPQLHQSSLINNQALKDTRATIYQNQSIFSGRQKSRSLQNQSINDKNPFFGTENRQSVIFTYNKVQAGDSNIQKTKMKASNNSSTNGFARSKILKISDIIENTQKPVPIIKISSIQLSKSSSSNAPKKVSINCINYKDQLDCQDIAQNDPLLSDNILTQNDPNLLQLNNKKAISVSERQARFNKDKNRQRKVSILEKSDNQKIQKMGSVMYARTYNQLAFDDSFKDIQMGQAPWKTHKTITRLIRDDDSDSLVHSLGTSSQSHLNEDPYKGILSKMCRDVTKNRISDVLIQ